MFGAGRAPQLLARRHEGPRPVACLLRFVNTILSRCRVCVCVFAHTHTHTHTSIHTGARAPAHTHIHTQVPAVYMEDDAASDDASVTESATPTAANNLNLELAGPERSRTNFFFGADQGDKLYKAVPVSQEAYGKYRVSDTGITREGGS